MSKSSKEIANSAALTLKGKALESYGIIKDLLSQKPEPGVSDQVATAALQLVQYEGAALTLQQYFGEGISEEEEVTESPPAPVGSEDEERPLVVTAERSPTYKRSLEKEKIKKTVKKRSKNDEK